MQPNCKIALFFMSTRRIFLSVLSLFAVAVLACGEVWYVKTVPSPKIKGQNFYVSNPDGVLSPETESQLNEMMTRLEQATEVEVAVVAVDKFDEDYYTYGFALDLFNYWGIGKADKNTGVLIFLARAERDIQIITGKGIEGILTDIRCGEFLDDNLDYLKRNDFDGGMLHICQDMSDYLMDDKNRGELLLGWSPMSTEDSYVIAIYLMLGFIMMVIMALLAYKKLRAKPGQTQLEVQENGSNVRSCSGCLAFVFPIPMLFFYIYYRWMAKRIPTIPLNCSKCGKPMNLAPDDETTGYLSKEERVEKKIGSREFTLWICPHCGHKEFVRHKGPKYKDFIECTHCHSKASKLTKTETLIDATYTHDGKRLKHYTCQCCGGETTITERIPMKEVRSSSSSSSGGGGGSWGGGSSSGGGAGRSF